MVLLHIWFRHFSNWYFSLGLLMEESACKHFMSEFSFLQFYGFPGCISHFFPPGFQSLAFRELISLVQDLRIRVPDVEQVLLTLQGKVPDFLFFFQLSITVNGMEFFMRKCLPLLPISMLSFLPFVWKLCNPVFLLFSE